MTSLRRKPSDTDMDFVDAFLRANPGWLADRPDLYRVLAPPVRVHGDHLSDHMAAMLRVERAHAAAMAERADDVLAAGRAAAGLMARVQAAVVALIRAEDVVDCVVCELPGILAVDAVAFCIEGRGAVDERAFCVEGHGRPGARSLPPRAVSALLRGRDVVFRAAPADAPILHGEAAELARHDALVRVPGQPEALLALVSRDAVALDPSQGTGALAFLGRAVAATLGR